MGWLFRMASKAWSKKFRLHETMQRELCRVVFLLIALLPCLFVLGYTALRSTPWYQAYQLNLWQQRISDNLGVHCRFSSITFPSPDRFRANQFVCLHPETGKEILKVAQVDAAMDRSGWSVTLSKPELNGLEVQNAMQILHDWFLCRPQKSASLLRLSVPELAVFDGVATTTFQNIDVGLKPTESLSTVYVKFSVEGQKFAEPGILVVERNHALENPTTTWTLKSQDISIPCNAIASRFPILKSLGQDASFKGRLAWIQNDVNWIANVNGIFSSVDMAVLSLPLGAPLRGKGQLAIHQAEIIDSKLQFAQGSMDVEMTGHESVDGQWVNRTYESGLMAPEKRIKEVTDKRAPLQYFGMSFELDDRGLLIEGKRAPPREDWPRIAMIVDGKHIAGPIDNATGNGLRVDLKTVAAWLQSSYGTNADGSLVQNDQLGRFLSQALPWAGSTKTTVATRVATDHR